MHHEQKLGRVATDGRVRAVLRRGAITLFLHAICRRHWRLGSEAQAVPGRYYHSIHLLLRWLLPHSFGLSSTGKWTTHNIPLLRPRILASPSPMSSCNLISCLTMASRCGERRRAIGFGWTVEAIGFFQQLLKEVDIGGGARGKGRGEAGSPCVGVQCMKRGGNEGEQNNR